MKKLFLIVSLILSTQFLKAQLIEGKLRLVAGFPDFNFVPETSDLVNVSAILKIEKDSLVEELLITDSLQRLYFLRSYPEYKKIIAMTKLKRNIFEETPSLPYEFTIVDMETLEKNMVSIPSTVQENGVSYSFYSKEFSSIIRDYEILFILKFVNFEIAENENKARILYYLFNPRTKILKKTEPSTYKSAIANSGNLVLANNYEGEILKGDTVTNILRIATSKFYGNPIYCDYLPTDAKISRKSYAYAAATVLINNDNILALYLYQREQHDGRIYCKIHVYNKLSTMWASFDIETSWVLAKYYDNYIAGNYRVKRLESEDPDFPFNKKYWDKEKTKYGPSYRSFFIESPVLRYYSEGDLYLYNIKKGVRIYWNTGHGDSEVLLVQDGIVYYRADDRVFGTKISKNGKLGKAKLIIQDARVRDIHWAFIER